MTSENKSIMFMQIVFLCEEYEESIWFPAMSNHAVIVSNFCLFGCEVIVIDIFIFMVTK